MTWTDQARAKAKRERIINCRDCGVEVVARSARRFLCTACRIERQNKRNAARPPTGEPLYCVDCDEPLVRKSVRGKLPTRCEGCKRLLGRNRKREERARLSHLKSTVNIPKAWRVTDNALNAMDKLQVAEGALSDCYTCKFLAMCRRNIREAGFTPPCFKGDSRNG